MAKEKLETERLLQLQDSILVGKKFTPKAITFYSTYVRGFASDLLAQIQHKIRTKGLNEDESEVSADDVRECNMILRQKLLPTRRSTKYLLMNLFEYPLMGAVGLGASNMDKPWGPWTFGVCLALAVVSITSRMILEKQ